VRNAVEKTVTTLGGLDVLVNNAGTVIPMKVEETTKFVSPGGSGTARTSFRAAPAGQRPTSFRISEIQ